MKRFSVAIWLALCVVLTASAQVYKWVDADGKVHYSDKPPESNVKSEKLHIGTHTGSTPVASEAKGAASEGKSAASEGKAPAGAGKGAAQKDAAKDGPKTAAEQEQAFRKRQLDAAKAQKDEEQKQAQARDKAENCKRAKAALADLQIGGRQTRVDEKGERVFLDEQQIARETARARGEAAAACN